MNVRIAYTMPFAAGVFNGEEMRMNNYTLRVAMITNCIDPDSQNIAFERVKHFVYHQLDSTILINQSHKEVCQKYLAAGLRITTLPDEPVDQIVGIMLYSKLNAIMEDRVIVFETDISSDMGDSVSYFHAEDEHLGPFEGVGWWKEADLVHYDTNLLSSKKVVEMHKVSAWRDLELSWPDTILNDDEPPANDNTVVFAKFKKDETK